MCRNIDAKSVRKENSPGLYPYLKMSRLFTPRNAGTIHNKERTTIRLEVTHGVPCGRASRLIGKTNIATSQERVL
jgi:hypothetical protein